jgi:dihydropteroate synthase
MSGPHDSRSLVMGVLNVTPDSFSDGGRFLDTEAAVAHGLAMVAEGADVVDVGGESSRPGAEPVSEGEELNRVIPVVEALALQTRVSIDTVKPGVARAAVAAGASLINDISARLGPVAADLGVGWVAMHMQGEPRTMQANPHYDSVCAEVYAFVLSQATKAAKAGVGEIWVDPGLGFGKSVAHNLALLHHIDTLVAQAHEQGFQVMIGASRKRFLGVLSGTGEPVIERVPVDESDRLEGSLATAVAALAAGVDMVRVHDVGPTVQAACLVGVTNEGFGEPSPAPKAGEAA